MYTLVAGIGIDDQPEWRAVDEQGRTAIRRAKASHVAEWIAKHSTAPEAPQPAEVDEDTPLGLDGLGALLEAYSKG